MSLSGHSSGNTSTPESSSSNTILDSAKSIFSKDISILPQSNKEENSYTKLPLKMSFKTPAGKLSKL